MIAHAYRTVPYYRETMDRLGLKPSAIQTVEDLEKLPVIERLDVQKNPDYFVSTAQPKTKYFKLQSGGSTGEPCTIYHHSADLFQNAAHSIRERSIMNKHIGKSMGYKETILASRISSAAEIREYVRNNGFFPKGVGVERNFLSILDPPEKNLLEINNFQPDVLLSYGSYLEILFPYILKTGSDFHKPKLVMYGADGLSSSVRKLITETFQIPVFSSYQAIEALKIGFECEEHSGLHLNIDLYPVRIADEKGRSLTLGESGDVILSNLINKATVLLNYRLGDITQIQKEPCRCGRTLPLMSFPQGRTDDWILLPSGKVLHPQSVRTIFTREKELWSYQVVQDDETRFRVFIVTSNPEQKQIQARITSRFVELFGQSVQVEISFVDSIARTSGGKTRVIISPKKRV